MHGNLATFQTALISLILFELLKVWQPSSTFAMPFVKSSKEIHTKLPRVVVPIHRLGVQHLLWIRRRQGNPELIPIHFTPAQLRKANAAYAQL